MDLKEQAIEIINNFFFEVQQLQVSDIEIFWQKMSSLLINSWANALIAFFIFLILSLVNIYSAGRFRILSELLYRISYLGILFVVISIFQIEINISHRFEFLPPEYFEYLPWFIGIVIFEIALIIFKKFRFK